MDAYEQMKAKMKEFEKKCNPDQINYPNESVALHTLMCSMLIHNNYFENLREYCMLRDIKVQQLAAELNGYYDDAPEGIGVYRYLDCIENYLKTKYATKDTWVEDFVDVGDIINAMYEVDAWED